MTRTYRRLHILVEGQTEETLVKNEFEPHLRAYGWSVSLSILTTKRVAGGPSHKGGLTSWNQLRYEIRQLLRDSSIEVLTTMLDYYAFPPDAPGMTNRPTGTPQARVEHVENALNGHFGDDRLCTNLVLHEAEAWVFAASDQLAELHGSAAADRIRADVLAAGGPELINDDPKNAPSKRLSRYCSGYVKTLDGPLAITSLGLAGLRSQCPHLDAWLRHLETS